jgi:conjugative relaxase-like TrwC/TraI family protein
MAVETPRTVGNAEYYLEETPLTEPKWKGEGAKLLGLEGQPLDRETYLNLFAGYTTDADGNRDKKLPKYMHPERRGAIELTVSLPKDVSIANLVGQDQRIDEVFHKAVQAVADEVERQALVKTTKQEDSEKYRRTGNLVYTVFDHSSSRASDPHRHAHLVFMGLSYDRGTWKSIELGMIGVWQSNLEKAGQLLTGEKPKGFAVLTDVFNNTMRKGLNELGYKTKADGRSFKIVGFPAEVKGVFSSRNGEIKEREAEWAAKKGQPLTGKAKGKLSVIDRPEKPSDTPLPERRKGWLARLNHGQFKAVASVVKKAKEIVKGRSLGSQFAKWQADLTRHASQLRNSVIMQDPESPDRSRDNGRTR